jgi:hypothetical protein
MVKLFRLVIAEIRATLMTFLFLFLLAMLLNELSKLPWGDRQTILARRSKEF